MTGQDDVACGEEPLDFDCRALIAGGMAFLKGDLMTQQYCLERCPRFSVQDLLLDWPNLWWIVHTQF